MECSCQAPLSMEFSRQEYWSGLPFPSPGESSQSGIEPRSSLQADSLPFEPPGKPFMFYFRDVDTGKAREEVERSLEGGPGSP